MRSQKSFLGVSSGFSLLEITVALFILAIGFSAVLSLVTKSITVLSEFSNEVIATNLAAENIELLINRRNTNWLRGCPYDFFDQDNNGDCMIDSGVTSTIFSCPSVLSTNMDALRDFVLDTDDMVGRRAIVNTRLYTHTAGGIPTPFRRHLELCKESFGPNPQNYFIKARSISWWEERGRTRAVELTDHLYDWKP